MSGEIFFDFGVKPVKKRKSQVRENQVESTENEEENENSEVRGGREKNHIWKRTDYTKASAVDAMGLYSSGKQNESDNSATRRKVRLLRKPKRKSKHRQRIRGKERKDEKQKKDEEEIISLSSEISKSEKDEKERKKRKKRKKKRSDESTNGREIDRKGRILKTKKKRRPFRPKDNDDEDDTGLEKRAVTISAPAVHSSSQPHPPVHVEENTKTALCAPSMESMLPDDDDMDDIKPPVSYKAMYEGGSESKYTDMEWSVELRYWIVLVVFISLLIIYRSLLPPLQCDTKFQ
ncbi:Uncharacterized protein BM_BM17484 [Brugia malayi]|uniref:Uncharacterized protein n=1 Tax=Brugia malayi TaxID=6279 RepID=A0A4E9F913_BRUMA|nr:Uncharacterized protein BM_BM17484 [Brugia malayi]VIO93324.1 Uncharacterized protein BM_BM17484 [Brugia malayi]